MKRYEKRNHIAQDKAGNYYSRHVCAMTAEGLHAKSDIAAELAHRDIEIDRLRAELEALRQQKSVVWSMENETALNTLAKVTHNGEEVEGEDGLGMFVDMALWNEMCEAVETLVGEEDASDAIPQS